jgi:hypothetical protein
MGMSWMDVDEDEDNVIYDNDSMSGSKGEACLNCGTRGKGGGGGLEDLN